MLTKVRYGTATLARLGGMGTPLVDTEKLGGGQTDLCVVLPAGAGEAPWTFPAPCVSPRGSAQQGPQV